jgi:phosphatidylethanolamine-binding protein
VIGNFDPKYFLSVLWPSNKTANLGNAIIPDDVQDEPAVEIQNVDDGSIKTSSHATITVAMTDPDAPSRDDPKWSEFCHWIVTGLGTSKSNCVSSSKSGHTDVMSYRPPSPPEKTGFHRYVFLAFEAKNGTSKKLHLTKPDDRKHWGTGKKRHGVRNWADDNDLVPVGRFSYTKR